MSFAECRNLERKTEVIFQEKQDTSAKSNVCEVCNQSMRMTPIEILKHKKKCSNKNNASD